MKRRFFSRGHLIDSGLLTNIFNLIIGEGADYEIASFEIGKKNEEFSFLEIDVMARSPDELAALTEKLIRLGCYEKKPGDAVLKPAPGDGCVPEDFYSTTNHRTEVYLGGSWCEAADQRMDAVIVSRPEGLSCRKLRDVKKDDLVVCGSESVRVFPPFRERNADIFSFMGSDASSERSVNLVVDKLAEELWKIRREGGKIIVVAGPVVIHTGGAAALAFLIREGWVDGLLAGNALAVHDLESVFYGTSLGIDIATGKATHEGHKNHLRAINRINMHGSIQRSVEAGDLTRGIMFEAVKRNLPFCLAGSIRDDGPLYDTVTDMVEAQRIYAEIVKGASLVLMLASMLHSIGTGNMLPSWVRTVCVDINPAAVTKLSDRGSSQTLGIVSDVGLFLRSLAQKLEE